MTFMTVSIAPSFVLSSEAREDYLHLYSDYHKDAYGFRPRFDYRSFTDAQLVNDYETFGEVCRENRIAEDKALVEDLKAWDELVDKTIHLGAGNRATALRWLFDGHGDWDIEAFVWSKGILFCDEGRALVKEIEDVCGDIVQKLFYGYHEHLRE